MKIIKSTSALFLAAFVAGCSQMPSGDQDNALNESALITAEACCNGFAQFPWIGLEESESLDFVIDESSPVGVFDDGKSYFASFKLPERSEKVKLTLNSFMSGSEVFAPKLIALDEHFKPVQEIDLEQLDVKTSSMFTRSQYSTSVTLLHSETPYVVIYSPQAYLNQKITVPHPARVRAEELGEARPMVTDPVYQHAPTGKLELELDTLTLRAFNATKSSLPETKATPEEAVLKPALSSSQMLAETEQFYHQQIEEAVAENDMKKALRLVEEAKRAGSKSAEDVFIQLIKK